MTKICVPLSVSHLEDIEEAVQQINMLDIDIIEWRADMLDDFTPAAVEKGIQLLNQFTNTPLLVTIRTKEEGGNFDDNIETYHEILELILNHGQITYVDFELTKVTADSSHLFTKAEEKGIKIFLSHHNFQETISKLELETLYEAMSQAHPAPIIKIVMMPKDERDVLNLMDVAIQNKGRREHILISMGELGEMTRTYAPFLGSYLSFAIGIEASAPGQVTVKQLKSIWTKEQID